MHQTVPNMLYFILIFSATLSLVNSYNCTLNYVFLVHNLHSFVRRSPWLQYFRRSGRETHAFINGARWQHEGNEQRALHGIPRLNNHSSSTSMYETMLTVLDTAITSAGTTHQAGSASPMRNQSSQPVVTVKPSDMFVLLPEDSFPVKSLHDTRVRTTSSTPLTFSSL